MKGAVGRPYCAGWNCARLLAAGKCGVLPGSAGVSGPRRLKLDMAFPKKSGGSSYSVVIPKPATCHPDRDHVAKGLCASCYVTARRKRLRPLRTEEQKEQERAYQRAYRRAWRKKNPERSREIARESQRRQRERNPAKHRQRVAARRYGLTVEQYLDMIACEQCDACGEKTDRLQIDHCHATGKIRGVLCGGCNSSLGHAGDDAKRLRQLIEYLAANS